jgi:hypothetical protein
MDVAFKRHMVMARAGVTKQITTVLDDIHMTPDGYDPATKALESYKRTKLSAKNALSVEAWVAKFGLWMVQEGSYWHALEAAGYEIDSIRWYVYWVNGDYSRQAGKGQFVGIYLPAFGRRVGVVPHRSASRNQRAQQNGQETRHVGHGHARSVTESGLAGVRHGAVRAGTARPGNVPTQRSLWIQKHR